MLTVAIQTPPEHTTFAALRDLWQAADGLGFRAAFTFDHLVPLNPATDGALDTSGPQLEGWTTLTALAAGTRRLAVGTLVSGVTYRHPSLLAKMAVTLDHVTGGRAILGIGAAWHEAEHRAFGLPFPAVGEQVERLGEALTLVRRLFAADVDAPVTFDGRWYALHDAVFDPRPVRPTGIPVLVGGSGPRVKRLAARHADVFNTFAAPWEWPAVNAELDALLAAAGRAPADLERTAFVFCELSGDRDREDALVAHFVRNRGGSEADARRRVVLGDPEQAVAVLRAYHEAGVSMAVLNLRPPVTVAALERFAAEVLPALAAAPTPGPAR